MTTTARPRGLYATDVGKKYVMAVSGIVLMLFVLGHMVGNLKLYLGADSLNAYSHGCATLASRRSRARCSCGSCGSCCSSR